jgi:glycogen debranching enzyme
MPDRVALKANRVMVVTDELGDILPDTEEHLGIYLDDTRFVSRFHLRFGNKAPVLLSYAAENAAVAIFRLVNATLRQEEGKDAIPRQSISIRRTRFVTDGLHERIEFENFAPGPRRVECALSFDSDFRDLFDVRAHKRRRLGVLQEPVANGNEVLFEYHGADGVRRLTRFSFDPAPDVLERRRAVYQLDLAHGEITSITIDVVPGYDEKRRRRRPGFDRELEALQAEEESWHEVCSRYRADDRTLNDGLIRRSEIDLGALTERLDTGMFPVAGLPFFAAPFGRDSIITSIESMSMNPGLALGTLRYLASHQGRVVNPELGEEPGKILHELRLGELANLKKIPFSPSFQSIDATPLYLVLLAETMRWLDDGALFEELLPATMLALEWIDTYGDFDGDGFVEYRERGHGWKDSYDSLLYPDGRPVRLPAALVEVQGYVYRARAELAEVFERLGNERVAAELRRKANALRKRFEAAYWLPDEEFYAQALDGDKQPAGGVSSNVGHCLWAGILSPKRAKTVAQRLLAPDMFSGWGVRTLTAQSPNYNPMSYHNGTVWPHDNALIVGGLRRYGLDEEAAKLVSVLFEAGLAVPRFQLPELYCGFLRDRRFDSAPAQYLLANIPQAWSTAATFYLLENVLGIRPDAAGKRIAIAPIPVPWLRRLSVQGMRIGTGRLSIGVKYDELGGASVDVREAPDGFEVDTNGVADREAA